MFAKKQKKVSLYKLTHAESEKVHAILSRIERASEEVIAARAIFQATLQSTIQVRQVRTPEGCELVLNFDDMVIYAEPVKSRGTVETQP